MHAPWDESTHLTELESLGLVLLTELGVGLPLLQQSLGDEHVLGARHRTGPCVSIVNKSWPPCRPTLKV